MRTSHSAAAHPTHRIALPIGQPSPPAGAAQWVVCGGAFREAPAGLVTCPLQGVPIAIGECLGCHCLVTHSGERDPLTDCVTTELS